MNLEGVELVGGALVAPIEGGAQLGTPAWPLGFVGIVGLAAGVAAVAFVVAAVRGGLGRPGFAVLPPLGAFLVAAAATALPFLGADPQARSTTVVFRPVFDLVAPALAVPILVVGLAAAAWVARAPGGVDAAAPGRFQLDGTLLTALSASLAAAGAAGVVAAWMGWLVAVGPVPDLALGAPLRLHVGQGVEVTAPDTPGWTTAPVRLRADAPGPLPWEAVTRRFGLTLTTRGQAEAGADTPSPLLPLAVGNHWRFGSTSTWHSQYLWFFSSDHEAPGEGYTFAVTGEAVAGGLHTWTVLRTRADLPPASFTVYGWNGKTYLASAEAGAQPGPGDGLFIETTGPASAGVPAVAACDFAGLPGFSCSCFPRAPGGELGLAGPARCVANHGSVGSALVSGLLALVTVGLVVEDPDRTEIQELVRSGR